MVYPLAALRERDVPADELDDDFEVLEGDDAPDTRGEDDILGDRGLDDLIGAGFLPGTSTTIRKGPETSWAKADYAPRRRSGRTGAARLERRRIPAGQIFKYTLVGVSCMDSDGGRCQSSAAPLEDNFVWRARASKM